MKQEGHSMRDDGNDASTLLNVSQRGGLATALSVLEEMLYEIELDISYRPCHWIMFEISDALSAPVKREIVTQIAIIRDKIGTMMEEFALKKRAKSTRGEIMGKLSYAWQILEGTKAKHLTGYGVVAEGLAERLDPQLNAIILHVDELRNLISNKECAPDGDLHT